MEPRTNRQITVQIYEGEKTAQSQPSWVMEKYVHNIVNGSEGIMFKGKLHELQEDKVGDYYILTGGA